MIGFWRPHLSPSAMIKFESEPIWKAIGNTLRRRGHHNAGCDKRLAGRGAGDDNDASGVWELYPTERKYRKGHA
jgi:hypothetical protein